MKELKVTPIRNGTVIDHIESGMALKVLRILGLPRENATSVVSGVMNVQGAHGRKDIVKIEDRELERREVDRIALIAPRASVNIIREYEVARKERVKLPDVVQGLVRCSNANCITNHEPVTTRFQVHHNGALRLRCTYCDRDLVDIAENIRP